MHTTCLCELHLALAKTKRAKLVGVLSLKELIAVISGRNRIVGKTLGGLWGNNLETFFRRVIHIEIRFKNCITKTSSGKRGRFFHFQIVSKTHIWKELKKTPN